MLLTFIGLVKFSVGFIFSVSNTKYHILCTAIVLALSLATIPPSFPLALISCYDLISKHICNSPN